MKIVGSQLATNHPPEGRVTATEIRLCFSYTHTEAPLDGINSFTRALREHISRTPGFAFVNDLQADYDVLFMNQLERSPGIPYALSEIRAALGDGEKKKLVVRAVNLNRNNPDGNSTSGFPLDLADQSSIDLLNLADFVIFQSAFQKGFFDRCGYKGKCHAVIHNGAASVFRNVPRSGKRLGRGDDLILVSSSMSTNKAKMQAILAALSLIPRVRVIHSGVWPANVNPGKVELAGVQSHAEMASLYESGNFFLHPASLDVCPNSLIEGLCAGLPAIYNPGPGSGTELAGDFGVALDERDLPGTVTRARKGYERLAIKLEAHRDYYSIERAAADYINIFKTVLPR